MAVTVRNSWRWAWTKSLGARLKLVCDGPELKTLCHYFHIKVIIQQNVLIYYYSGVDAHDCECWNGEHLGMSMNKAVVDNFFSLLRTCSFWQ